MFNKLKQFKDMRSQAKTLQNALKEEKVEIEKHGIRLTMDGNQEIVFFNIDANLLSLDKKHELENNLRQAVNSAIEKTKRVMAEKMQKMGGFDKLGFGKS